MIAHPHSPVIGNRYIVEDLLGEGGVGAVYRAKDRLTGREIALKRLIDPHNTGLNRCAVRAGSRISNSGINAASEYYWCT